MSQVDDKIRLFEDIQQMLIANAKDIQGLYYQREAAIGRRHDRAVSTFVYSPASLTSLEFPILEAQGTGKGLDGLGAGQYSVLQDAQMIEGPQCVDKPMEAPAVSAFGARVGANYRTRNSDVLIILLLVIITSRMNKPSRSRVACGPETPSSTRPLRPFSRGMSKESFHQLS